jgi:hypothetical protein
LDGKKEDAKKLNRAIDLLGSEVDPEIIIKKISGTQNYSYKNNSTNFNKDKVPFTILDYAVRFISKKDINDGFQLLKLVGGSVNEIRIIKGIFSSEVGYEVTYKKTREVQLSRPEFIRFMIKIAEDVIENQ